MTNRGLFSRLKSGDVHTSRRGDPLEAVTEHLRMLFNTRKGESVSAPGFGIMDFNDIIHTFPSAIERMQMSLRQAIQDYEPRLKNVVVLHVPDELDPTSLKFEVSAQLMERGSRRPIRFFTRLGRNSQVEPW
ncbi:type VI secretion system baseplate subunit TssE [Hyalangium gracile]|uniref:type VI secretion system baseplate subunit TssE n=1 Tax=Hyalangium gracile TaxID=394092 RepID=UPI001CCB718F|nr:type VI secretion system baseplate subunit TssE [Hyalangium gracile]